MNNSTKKYILQCLEDMRRKLLDCTVRNKLLNFPIDQKLSSLRILNTSPNQLYQQIFRDEVIQFSSLPIPTRKQIREYNLSATDHYHSVDEKIWAEKLGIDLNYDLPMEYKSDDNQNDQIIQTARDFISEHLKMSDSPININEIEEKTGLVLDNLTTLIKKYGYTDIEDFEREVKQGKPLKARYFQNNLADNQIQTAYFLDNLDLVLKSINEKSQSSIRETGSSILYIVLGFLEWYEVDDYDHPRLAPLFTIPVSLEKGNASLQAGLSQYYLRYTGEEILLNFSLKEKLQCDFGIVLPPLTEGMWPEDYFLQIQNIIEKNKSHWSVRRYGVLGLLNFSKMLMYHDLDHIRWPEGQGNILNHEIIQRLFIAQSCDNEKTTPCSQDMEYKIDEIEDIHQKFPLIDDADSSQHCALIDVVDGKNLVIEGPPGTGKSQTITNIIAAAMLHGKKVLFCAQKMAAIDVVKQRLEKAGLGHFCLELHSHKLHKRAILDDLRKSIDRRSIQDVPQEIDVAITRCDELKAQINHYAQEINQIWKNTELTIHQILMGASRHRHELKLDPAQLHVEGLCGENANRLSRSRLEDQVKAFKDVVLEFRKQAGEHVELMNHPWYGVHSSDIHALNYRSAISSLSDWQSALVDWQKNHKAFLDQYSIQDQRQQLLSRQEQLVNAVEQVPVSSKLVCFEAFKKFENDTASLVQKWIGDFNCIRDDFDDIKPYLMPKKMDDLKTFKDTPVFSDLCQEIGMSTESSFKDVRNIISSLQETMISCEKYWKSFSELIEGFPLVFSKQIFANRQGLQNAVVLMDLAIALPIPLLRFRDSFFENDGIDSVLEELSERLDSLHCLRESLKDVFNLKKLPSADDLKNLNKELRSSGLFSSFNSSWKQAKQSLLNLAKNPNISWKILYAQLPSAHQFVVERDKLEKRNFGNTLGEYYQGISTDIASLRTLREWYRKVRHIQNDHSGLDSVLVGGFLMLDSQLFKGIQKLHRDGLSKQITIVLDRIAEFERFFPDLKELQDHAAILIGEHNILDSLLQRVSHPFSQLQSWFIGDDILLQQSQDIGERLHQIQQQRIILEGGSFIKDLFGKEIKPNVVDGHSKDTKQSLSVINSTVEFVNSIKENVLFDELVAGISQIHDLNSYNTFVKDLKKLKIIWRKHVQKRESFIRDTSLDMAQWTLCCNDDLVKLIARNAEALNKPRWLNGWINLMYMVQDMQEKGLKEIQAAIFDATLDIKNVESALLAAIYHQLSHEIFTEKPHLMHYSGIQFFAKQERFREYDKKLQILQRKRIAHVIGNQKLVQGVSGGRKSDYTELSLIRSELGKKTRHIPVRQLISRAQTSLLQLKPCFMMSPMSVANYLEPGEITFDLVIMDESSQIKPEDALGVIARGKQIVVVGDPKQLPPTRFFDHDSDGQEDYDDEVAAVSQTESILDALLPLFFMRRLQWHYRSLNESLIACSNYHFYDNDLIVFPSPYTNVERYGIGFTHVKNGTMVNQCNPEEAQVIALAVKDHAIKYPQESLGIVTMNAKQRDQVENAINSLCRKDSVIEKAINRLRIHRDPFFVKNLENVQGDERDTIFISFTYGPNEPGGRIFQRFGPINSDVGWRRLNVLFTRARKRIDVFSTMRYLDILIDADSKRGVRVMRDFLRFAETGYMEHAPKNTVQKQDSDFAISVMAELEKVGFSCDSQLGDMGFSLDVAVRDPLNPGYYLMGIECDGAMYNSAKSARDRDRLRQEILERMGWRIRRIGSVDWFSNPDEAIAPIISELRKLTEKSHNTH
ncbi:MAG: DUF4011 domain-containing protein [Candidatus Liberibacter ctenarytainae]|uniref:DUF4011 domain-containing protein n=1 Tax=Candidatus Liberibacter ctenarytainae TaxID=2020335 RepID=A0A937ACQ3_9HYPH|nr:DUF4011 domain-containing protein [Candidatus Liberibacter ctenarytainae]